MLPNDQKCPGRLARYFGGTTIARECSNCLRRTDLPAHMTGLQLDPKPKYVQFRGYCEHRLTVDDVEAVT